MAAVGAIRGADLGPGEDRLPLGEIGLDSLALAEVLMLLEGICDGALASSVDPAAAAARSLEDLFGEATAAAAASELGPWGPPQV